MPFNNDLQLVSLSGNIIEIFQCNDCRCARVLINPAFLNIDLSSQDDFRLGDELNVYCQLEVVEVGAKEPNQGIDNPSG